MLRAPWVLFLNFWTLVRMMIRAPLRYVVSRLSKQERRFVRLELPAGLALSGEVQRFGPVSLRRRERGAWWDFREALDRIAEDAGIEGVYLKMRRVEGGLAEVMALGRALEGLRAKGKRVVVHLDQAMLREYALASAGDVVALTPAGRLYTFGLRMELSFYGEALERLGVRADFMHLGPFKTAMHRLSRRRATQAQVRGTRQLLEGMADVTLGAIAARRGVSSSEAEALLELAPLSAREAARRRLIDRVVFAEDVKASLEAEQAGGPPVALVSMADYLKVARAAPQWRSLRRAGRLGVLSLSGAIMMGDEGGLVPMRGGITPKETMKALERLRRDPTVKAVLLHIDSPGGSALASELIWRAIRDLDAEKPVVAFLGNVAASGGYYMAVAARRIVAMPETLTGSIGVIAGKVSGGALLERLGVHTASVSVGGTAGFGSLSEGLSGQEIENLRRDLREFYRRFLLRVAEGRRLPKRRLHRIARGRVYTGRRALGLGLIDQLGDLEDALALACREGGLDPRTAPIALIDPRPTGLRGLLKRGASLEVPLPAGVEDALVFAALLRRPGALAFWPHALPAE